MRGELGQWPVSVGRCADRAESGLAGWLAHSLLSAVSTLSLCCLLSLLWQAKYYNTYRQTDRQKGNWSQPMYDAGDSALLLLRTLRSPHQKLPHSVSAYTCCTQSSQSVVSRPSSNTALRFVERLYLPSSNIRCARCPSQQPSVVESFCLPSIHPRSLAAWLSLLNIPAAPRLPLTLQLFSALQSLSVCLSAPLSLYRNCLSPV